MTRKNTHTHTHTHSKKVSHSLVKELTGWQIRVRSFFPWRRILGKGPKLSIIIPPLFVLSSIEYHLVVSWWPTSKARSESLARKRPADERKSINAKLGIKVFSISPYGRCTARYQLYAAVKWTDEGSFKWHEILCVVWTLSWRFNGQRQQIEPIFNGVRTDDTKFVGVTLLSVFQ